MTSGVSNDDKAIVPRSLPQATTREELSLEMRPITGGHLYLYGRPTQQDAEEFMACTCPARPS